VSVAKTTEDHKDDIFAISALIWEGEDYIPTLWKQWIHEEGFYTIFHEEKVIGCMKYTKLPENEIMLEGLRIQPEERGRGHASIAVDFLMRHVDRLYPRIIRFATSDENVYSHHFGEKYGFRKIASFYHRFMKQSEIRQKLNEMETKSGLSGNRSNITISRTTPDDMDEVLSFLNRSDEWAPSKELLSYGWVFYPFTRMGVMEQIESEYSFLYRENHRISGVLLAHQSRQYPKDIDISWLSGAEEAVHRLLWKLLEIVEVEKVHEISGKPPTSNIADCMEHFGFLKHPRLDCTDIFEKNFL